MVDFNLAPLWAFIIIFGVMMYVVLDGFVNEEGEKTQEVAALAYGYSGGSTQSDYLFRRDGNNSLWLYSDSSGGEWKGAKTTPKGSHLYTEDAACPEWSEQDAQCQNILEGLWVVKGKEAVNTHPTEHLKISCNEGEIKSFTSYLK